MLKHRQLILGPGSEFPDPSSRLSGAASDLRGRSISIAAAADDEHWPRRIIPRLLQTCSNISPGNDSARTYLVCTKYAPNLVAHHQEHQCVSLPPRAPSQRLSVRLEVAITIMVA